MKFKYQFWQDKTNMNLTWLAELVSSFAFLNIDNSITHNAPSLFLLFFGVTGFLRESYLKSRGLT